MIKEILASELQNGNYHFYDTFLQKDKCYMYKVAAMTSDGETIGVSNEEKI